MRYFTRAAVQAAAVGAMVAVAGCAGQMEASAGPDAPYQVAGTVVKQPASAAATLYQGCNGGASGFVYSCDGFPRAYYP